MSEELKPQTPDELYAALRKEMAESTPTPNEFMARRVADMLRSEGTTGDYVKPKTIRSNAAKHPKGWEPGVKFDTSTGIPATIVSPDLADDPDLAGLFDGEDFPEREALERTLRIFRLMEGDHPGGIPDTHQIVLAETKLGADWERHDQGEDALRNRENLGLRFRWVVVKKSETSAGSSLFSSEQEWNDCVSDAIKGVNKKWTCPLFNPNGSDLVVPLGDFQGGQHDGDGERGLMLRALTIPMLVKEEIRLAKKQGRKVNRIILPVLGDLVEGVLGFYANQTWLVTMNRRQQAKLVRRLLKLILKEIAKLGYPMLVPCVPGNHGQHRGKNGKPVTDLSDNEDLTIVESVQESLHEHDRYRRQIEFFYPEDGRLTLTMEINGLAVVFLHGDVTGYGSGEPAAKMKGWIKAQGAAGEPAGDGNVYFSGHFHTATFMRLFRNRQWVMCPAICDESEHFTQFYGLTGGPATITCWLDSNGVSNVTEHRMPTIDVLWPEPDAQVVALRNTGEPLTEELIAA